MKLTVKTLKGGKFEVEVDDALTVEQVKDAIEKSKPELPAASQKLIHSGKVLKDTETISSCGIKPNDFLVVMITKAKKAAAAAPTPAPATATAPVATPKPADAPAAAATPAPTAAAPPAAPARSDDFPQEAVDNLTAMGFPEAEVRHCLRAAQGNPDVAVEFLTNGIPDSVNQVLNSQAGSSGGGAPTPAANSGRPLQALRNHPQFNDLRRLVQSNPQMLQQVLAQIGQQQPELLQEINANQALFLEMMNEPVTAANESSSSSSPGNANVPPGLPEGMGNPAQMAQMIQSMSPQELEQMAQMMGLSPEQLRMTAEMLGQMPPEQLQQFMMQAMGGGGDEGGPGGPQVLRLNEEEMAAVDRLAEMGFDRAEAAQAFLACDKNEALAANLLMDSMGDGGGFFGGGSGGSGDNNNNNDNSGGNSGGGSNDNDEDMYD